MDAANRYCFMRSLLEEHIVILTSKLFSLHERLCGLVGRDHQEFLATQLACSKTSKRLSKSRHRLEAHRIAHGC